MNRILERSLDWIEPNLIPLLICLLLLAVGIFLRKPLARIPLRLVKRFRRENSDLRSTWADELVKPLAELILATVLLLISAILLRPATSYVILNNLLLNYFTYRFYRLAYAAVDPIFADASFIAKKRGVSLDATAMNYLGTAAKVSLVVLGILTILARWVRNLSAIVAGVGVGGVVLALAAQDTAANLFASLAILLDKPFSIGDWITAEEVSGSVEKIGLRSTHIRMADRSLVIVPNAKLGNAIVTNMSVRNTRPVSFSIAVDPLTDGQKLALLVLRIRRLLDSTEGIEDVGKAVYFELLDTKQPGITLRFFTSNDYGAMLVIKEAVSLGIIAILEEEQVRLATTVVTVTTGGMEHETTDLGTSRLK